MRDKLTVYLQPSTRTGALIFIVAGAVLISFSSVFVKTANVAPTISGFYRLLFGGAILTIIVAARREPLWPGLKRVGWPLLCALFFALDLYFWHRSVLYVGPGLATLLGNCQVFFVAFIALFILKERMHWTRMLSIPVAMAGLLLVLGPDWSRETSLFKTGVLFGLLTAFAYALYIVAIRHGQSGEDRLSAYLNLAWISLAGAVMLGTAALFEPDVSFAIPDLQTWASLLALGIFGQVLGWVLISIGLPMVDASAGGLALLLQPALAYIWDIWFFGRDVGGIEFLGIGITLAAIYLGAIGRGKRETSKDRRQS